LAYEVSGVAAPLLVTGTSPLLLTATDTHGAATTRTYPGSVSILPPLTIVNTVDMEAYVAGVLAAEISPSWNAQSLAAQAIASRTYAARRIAHSAAKDYDVTDDTSNQVYRGFDGVVPAYTAAVAATAGQCLRYGSDYADVFYHSACGGHTASSEEISGQPAPAYLQGIADVDPSGHAYCGRSPYFKWRNDVDSTAIGRALDVDAATVEDLAVDLRWPDGRVKSVRASLSGAGSLEFAGRDFYGRMADVLGYKVLPSQLFDVAKSADGFTFTGNGVGHGVGMCQWGARGRGDAGQSAAQILAAYFPGTTLG